MQDEQGQEPDATSAPPVGDPPPATPAEPTPAPSPVEAKTFDEAYVKQLRKEAADYRKRATEAEAKVKASEDAQLSELEKAQKQAADALASAERAEAALKAERLRGAVTRTATKLGFADVDDAARFLDENAVERDDAGNPTNLDKLLGDVLKAKPYLKGQPANAAAMNPARSQTGQLTEEQQLRDLIYGNATGFFDPRVAVERGGGIAEFGAKVEP